MKKIVTLLMCLLLVMGATTVSFGAEATLDPPYDLTITSLKGATQIDLYRVVNIDESTVEDGVIVYTLNDKYQDVYDELGVSNVAGIERKTIADILDACKAAGVSNLAPDTTKDTTGLDEYTFEEIAMGYYYVVMTGPDGTVYNPILWTVPTLDSENSVYTDSTVVAKAHDPGVTKEVQEGQTWGEKADADISDKVSFKLTADVPKYAPNIADADVTYKLVDEMCKGLTWLEGEDIVVKGYTGSVGDQGTVIPAPFKATPTASVNGTTKVTTLTMDFDYADIKAFAYITVEYKAMLNADAQLGAAGNVNNVTFTYSDNAYDITETNSSKKDTTTVYTYGLDVLKAELGNDDIVLEGAEFTLKKGNETFKFIKNGDGTYTALSADLYDFANGTATPKDAANDLETYTGVLDKVTSDANGKIIIKGLDAGTYTLTETKAPDGYYIVEKNIEIVVTAESNQSIGLTGNVAVANGNEADTAGVYYEKTVYNSTEYVLPETGDKGIVMMTVWGVLMISAAYVLIYFKRKKSE